MTKKYDIKVDQRIMLLQLTIDDYGNKIANCKHMMMFKSQITGYSHDLLVKDIETYECAIEVLKDQIKEVRNGNN